MNGKRRFRYLLILPCVAAIGCSSLPKHAESKPTIPPAVEEQDPETEKYRELERDLNLYSD